MTPPFQSSGKVRLDPDHSTTGAPSVSVGTQKKGANGNAKAHYALKGPTDYSRPSPFKDHPFISMGAFAEGHYTEF